LAVLFTLLWAESALAHEELDGGVGFLTGLLHPALGFDHLLAMLSVGVLSAQIGGRAIWYVPASFVGVMVIGSVLGLNGVALPLVEIGIALSVLVLGLVIVLQHWIPAAIAIACVAFFAVFHGHAHGTEMPLMANVYAYGAGFVIGTATIHLAGVGIGLGCRRSSRREVILRTFGGLIAVSGSYILLGS
jgi:urease accessory protein